VSIQDKTSDSQFPEFELSRRFSLNDVSRCFRQVSHATRLLVEVKRVADGSNLDATESMAIDQLALTELCVITNSTTIEPM
jgi:hypothetical protein